MVFLHSGKTSQRGSKKRYAYSDLYREKEIERIAGYGGLLQEG